MALAERMRAVAVSTPGGPEVIELTDLPDPRPSSDEVLVRVRAAGLNRASRPRSPSIAISPRLARSSR